MADPVQIFFTVNKGDIWIDPEGIAWKVTFNDDLTTYLERKMTKQVVTRDMVRTWRMMGDTHPNHKRGISALDPPGAPPPDVVS